MKLKELTHKLQNYQKDSNRKVTISSIVFYACILLYVPIGEYIVRYFQRTSYPPAIEMVSAVPLLIFIIIGAKYFAWFTGKMIKQYGLTCPECASAYSEKRGEELILTGKCKKCDAVLLDDEPSKTLYDDNGIRLYN